MNKTRIVYRNNDQGDIRILPIPEQDMPQGDRDLNHKAWDAFFSNVTASHGQVDDAQNGAFFGTALVHLYQSTDNIWAVFGFDVRPGLDDHTIRFVRFAYRNLENGTTWPSWAHPPMAMAPDTARSCVKGWTELATLPMPD